jgi:hypothetical protein
MVLIALAAVSFATPEFARAYKMPCGQCHVHVPKLNAFGERFIANGYRIPGVEKAKTLPMAVWASLQNSNLATEPDRHKTIPNRIELIASGAVSDSMSYFVEWRVLSREVLNDGTIRDRSGRFEDLFVLAKLTPDFKLQVGQFRPLEIIDVSRRIQLSEPTVFSSSLPGKAGSNSRITGTRSFSPAGRSPAIKVVGNSGKWSGAITLPFPGEISLPLTEEAKSTASFEFESKPKGVFLEVNKRHSKTVYGLFGFVGDNRRRIIGVAFEHREGDVWFEGGIAEGTAAGTSDWRYSLGFTWIPVEAVAAGVRIDHRQIASETPIVSPYISLLKPCTDKAAKLIIEGRFQQRRTPRLAIELGWMF